MSSVPNCASNNNETSDYVPSAPGQAVSFAVQLDGQQYEFAPTDLVGDEVKRDQCVAASRCDFALDGILDCPDEQRRLLVSFLCDVQNRRQSTTFRIGQQQVHSRLQDCAFDLVRVSSSDERRNRAVQLALDVIAIESQSEVETRLACTRLAEILRQIGVRNIPARALIADAQAIQEQLRHTRRDAPQAVRDVWPDAPCDRSLFVPDGWRLDAEQITDERDGDAFPCRIMITRLYEDVETRLCSVELSWNRGHGWRSRVCSRAQVAERRTIVELSNYGVPVTSGNAAVLVDFLADFETRNIDTLPTSRMASRLGWHGVNGQDGFLCGNELIGVARPEATSNGAEQLRFRGEDQGDQQIAAAIRTGGSPAGWFQAITPIGDFPRAQFALYASLVPPLLSIVGAHNFVVSFDGRTSVGKTTVLTLAASCWGYPIVNGPERNPALFGWDATRVFVERAAAILNGIPLILDDTKVARDRRDITATVYEFANGTGRGRGSCAGVAATRSWQSVLLSSGEEPLTSFTRDGGSRARVLGLWGSPFQGADDPGQVTVRLREGLEYQFGHAGPQFVRFLASNRNHWEGWKDWYRQRRSQYQQRAGHNPVAGRMGACFAVLELAAYLAHQALQLPWDYSGAIESLWPEITANTDEADLGTVALQHVIAWCHSRRDEFESGRNREQPRGGWLGRWSFQGRDDVACIAIYPHVLDLALDARGLSPEAIRRLWKDNGWLRTEEQKNTIRISIGGQKSPVVAIRWDAINEAMDGSEECRDGGQSSPTGNQQGTYGSDCY